MKKLISLLLTLILTLAFSACTQPDNPSSESTSSGGDGETDIVLNTDIEIRISVLSGTTGMGIAPLMKSAKDGNEPLNYNFTVSTAADQIAPGIIQGSIDIAAVPTNLAATLYNKTNGEIRILCTNTKGVLYLLTSDPAIKSISDLKGKTVHVPGKGTNPEYILQHIIKSNGMTVGQDVIIDYTYTSPDDLTSALSATDNVSVALLPEPKVSAALAKNSSLSVIADITEEWNKVSNGTELYQGCIIVRKAFLDSNPNEVDEFLKKYEASINSVTSDPTAAAAIIAEMGIIPNATIAEKAIPNCNLCFVTASTAEKSLTQLYQILFEIAPASVGGAVPDSQIFHKK